MNTERSACKYLFSSVEVTKEAALFDKDYVNHAAEIACRDLAKKVFEAAAEGPIAFEIGGRTKNEIHYSDYDQRVEIRESVRYKPFTFCKDCVKLARDGSYNGGVCLKMQSIVHVMDGCTLGEKQPERGPSYTGKTISWAVIDETHEDYDREVKEE